MREKTLIACGDCGLGFSPSNLIDGLCKYCITGDWCNICDNPIKRKNCGVINYKTGLRAHIKCARKEGLID